MNIIIRGVSLTFDGDVTVVLHDPDEVVSVSYVNNTLQLIAKQQAKVAVGWQQPETVIGHAATGQHIDVARLISDQRCGRVPDRWEETREDTLPDRWALIKWARPEYIHTMQGIWELMRRDPHRPVKVSWLAHEMMCSAKLISPVVRRLVKKECLRQTFKDRQYAYTIAR